MRNMSFALTTEQVRRRTKTVTRRLGWKFAKAGDIVQPVVKSQGLKKGEAVTKIGGPIRFTSVMFQQLDRLLEPDLWAARDVVKEGFPEMTGEQFVEMFTDHNNCHNDALVTRIEFEYLPDGVGGG